MQLTLHVGGDKRRRIRQKSDANDPQEVAIITKYRHAVYRLSIVRTTIKIFPSISPFRRR